MLIITTITKVFWNSICWTRLPDDVVKLQTRQYCCFLCFLINTFNWSVDSPQIHFCPDIIVYQLLQAASGEVVSISPAPRGTPSSMKNPQSCWGLEIYHSLGLFQQFLLRSWGYPKWGTSLFLPLCVTFLPSEYLVLKDINTLARLQIPLAMVEVETNLLCVGALLF